MATIIAKNQTGGALAVAELPIPDQEIPASGQVTLTDYATVTEIQDSAEIVAYINSGDVLLNDGSNDLTQAESLNIASTYLQMSSVYVEYYGAGADSVTTSAATLVLDTTRQSNSLFVLAGNQITVQTGGGGDYLVRYDVASDESATGGQGMDIWLEVGGVEVTASRSKLEHYTTMTDNTGGRSVLLTLADAAVLRVRGQLTGGTGTLDLLAGGVNLVINTVGADGAAGPAGPTGSGSTINLEDDGSAVANTPHSTLNFVGMSVTDAGAGTADITVTSAIPESIVDAKGDLLAATADNTVARLAVGSDTAILTADSGETAGVKWVTPVAAKFANWYNNAQYTGITTTASTLPFPDTRISNAAFTIDGSGEEVTINTAGTYRIDFGASSAEASSSDIVAGMWLEVDTGSGFAEIEGTRSKWFHDANGEEGGNASFAIIVLAATDVFRIRAQVVQGSDQLNTDANALRLSIQTVGAEGAAGATGPQGPAGSGSTIIVEDEGSIVGGGPHTNLDFVGDAVAVTDAGSGVATITVTGFTPNIAQYRRDSNQTINTTAATIAFNATDFEDSNYTAAALTGLITINTAGIYKISYSVFFRTGGNFRRTVSAWVENNSTPIVPSVSADYARNTTDDEGSAGATFMVQLAASDVLTLEAQSVGTSGTCIGQADKMWICLEFIRVP